MYPISVNDYDEPTNRCTFRVLNGPEWITIDPHSGVMRCRPPETIHGRFEAKVHVSDNGQPPLEDETLLAIDVRGTPWARVESAHREAIYLVQLEKGGPERQFSWPFATSCAIGDHTLLSSGREVLELATLHRQGYRVSAFNPATGLKTSIRSFRVLREFAGLCDTQVNWIYVNLGLMETEHELATTVPLASQDELQHLEEGQPVACFGFTHDGGKITRFDKFDPIVAPGEVYLISKANDIAKSPRLLEIKADLPQNIFGSPVFVQTGGLVAVFGESAPMQNVGVKDLHYAPVLDPRLFPSQLAAAPSDDWVTAPETASPSVPQQSSHEQLERP